MNVGPCTLSQPSDAPLGWDAYQRLLTAEDHGVAESKPQPARCATTCAVVLAGDFAWDGSILETLRPRCLLPVAGRALIVHALEALRRCGIDQAVLCGNSNSEALRHHLGGGESLGMSLDYYVDGQPRGPAGCARDAGLVSRADAVLVCDACTLAELDFGELVDAHIDSAAALTVVACGRDTRPGSRVGEHEPAGIYVASRGALAAVGERGFQDIKEGWIPGLFQRGWRVLPYLVNRSRVLRVADPTSYLSANSRVLRRIVGAAESSRDVQPAVVHPSASVHPTARIIGPMFIGPGCRIGENSVLIGPVSLDAHVEISKGAVVSRTIAWRDVRIGADAVVDRSILPDRSRIPSGARVRDCVIPPGPVRSTTARVSPRRAPRAEPAADVPRNAPREPAVSTGGAIYAA